MGNQSAYTRKAIFFMIAWAVSFSGTMAINKLSANDFSIFTVLGIRCITGFFCLFPFFKNEWPHFSTTPLKKLHIFRGCLMAGSMIFTYWSYRNLPSYESAILGSSGSLMVIVLSELFLGERMGWRRWMIFAVGYSGVLCVIQPSSLHVNSYAIFLLIANIFYAGALVIARYVLTRGESQKVLMFYGVACPALVHGILFGCYGNIPQSWNQAMRLMAIGILGSLCQVFYLKALRLAPASFLAPFEYLRLCLFMILGWFLWGETPTPLAISGAVLIIASTLILAVYPMKKGKKGNS